jgi:hypothetical protein
MNVTPKTMARQITAAQAERVERARRVRVAPQVRLAFRSETGVVRPEPVMAVVEDDAHCFICGRHTDHFAEHDNLVEAGYARYEDDGSVTWTEKGWNEYRA